MRFIHGAIDEGLMEELLHALTWIDWDSDEATGVTNELAWWRDDQLKLPLSRAYAMLKLCFWPGAVGRGQVVAEPSIVPLRLAGRVADACAIAQRRLRAPRPGQGVVDLVGLHEFAQWRSPGDRPGAPCGRASRSCVVGS